MVHVSPRDLTSALSASLLLSRLGIDYKPLTAESLVQLRDRLGLTQVEMAKALSCRRRQLQMYETGLSVMKGPRAAVARLLMREATGQVHPPRRERRDSLGVLANEANEAVAWLYTIDATTVHGDPDEALGIVREVRKQLTGKLKELGLYHPPEED